MGVMSEINENINPYRGFGCFGKFGHRIGCIYCTVIKECKRESKIERNR